MAGKFQAVKAGRKKMIGLHIDESDAEALQATNPDISVQEIIRQLIKFHLKGGAGAKRRKR